MQYYGVYAVRYNTDTKFYGGKEWVVIGEQGAWSYPATITKEEAAELYRKGLSYEDTHKE